MAVDPEYLRKQYASLTDEALMDINPEDLVDVARQCYDAELRERELEPLGESAPDLDADAEYDGDVIDVEVSPDWLEEGIEVYSAAVRPGVAIPPDAANARETLDAEGIPCHLEVYEEEPEEPEELPPGPSRRWRLMVPHNLNLRATGVLQRDIFNDDFESGWRTRLEVLSDREVQAMDPRVVFCGLFDQIDRATRAYNEELARRRLPAK